MCVAGVSMYAAAPEKLEVKSPGGTQQVEFYMSRSASGANVLCYQVYYKGEKVIGPSRAGLELDNRVWEMALGKRSLPQPD